MNELLEESSKYKPLERWRLLTKVILWILAVPLIFTLLGAGFVLFEIYMETKASSGACTHFRYFPSRLLL